MITKEQLAAEMIRECDICLHLYTKLTPEAFGYRPSPDQRSTLELLRYLAICGSVGIRCMAGQSWKIYQDIVGRTKEMSPEQFPAAMERQKQEIKEFFAEVDEKTLENQPAPLPAGSGEAPLGVALLSGPLKWLTAYKMQLFLYAKAAGVKEIGTANVWRGRDRMP